MRSYLATLCIAFLEPLSAVLSPNHIKGMAIEHNHMLYTLNFDQQNEVIGFINRANLQASCPEELDTFGYTRLVIYRFNKPNVEIIPLTLASEDLVFKIKESGELKILKVSKLHDLLSQTYGRR